MNIGRWRARLECRPHRVGGNHVAGTRGRADHDVGLVEVRGERIQCDRGGLEPAGDALGAVKAAVRDDHAAEALRMQVAGRQLDHVAGADEQGRVLANPVKIRRASCTPAEATETALAPIAVSERTRLATAKVVWNSRFSNGPDCAALLRGPVGILELAEDLRFAENQRVEARGDAEQMAQPPPGPELVQAVCRRPACFPACASSHPDRLPPSSPVTQ